MWTRINHEAIFRSRHPIWWRRRVMPVAPHIVLAVSYVRKINHESFFSWQAQYLVMLLCQFGDAGVSLFVAGAIFRDVAVSLFVEGAVFDEIWVDNQNANCYNLSAKYVSESAKSNLGWRKYYSVLQDTTTHYCVLHSATKYYSVLHSTTKYYSVLQSTTQYCKVLLHATKYYLLDTTKRTTKYQSVWLIVQHTKGPVQYAEQQASPCNVTK